MEHAVTYENILLSTYKTEHILRMEIIKNVNEHGSLHVTAIVPEEEAEEYVYITTPMTPVTLEYLKEDKTVEILFRGAVVNIQINRQGDVCIMDLNVYGNTFAMDIIKQSRSFQNTSMTVHQLFREVISNYENCDIALQIPDEPIGRLVIQYQETDWEFLVRFASHYGAVLIPNVRGEKAEFFVGVPKLGEEYTADPYQYRISKSMNEYLNVKENQWPDVTETDFTVFQIQDYRVFQVGDRINLAEKALVVQSAHHVLGDGILYNTYQMKREKGLKGLESYNGQIVGASITGRVVDVARDKVMVELEIDEAGRAAYWFPYSTMSASPDGSGWYCMPEKGDQVRVYFPTNQESDAYAVSSVSSHQPQPGDAKDPMGNPNIKYLKSKADQVIQFQEDGILLNSGSGQATVFLGKSGELTVFGNTSLNVTAKETLNLISNGQLLIGATDSICVKKGEGTGITMDSDGNIKLSGTKIYSN